MSEGGIETVITFHIINLLGKRKISTMVQVQLETHQNQLLQVYQQTLNKMAVTDPTIML